MSRSLASGESTRTSPVRPRPARLRTGAETVEGLSRSDSARGRMVAGLGATIAVFGAIAALLAEGDPTARLVLLAGMAAIAISNLYVYIVVKAPERMNAGLVAVWVVSGLGALAAIPFIGVVSAGFAALFLVVVLVSLSSNATAASATYATVALGHAALLVLQATGITPERGRIPMPDLTPLELVIAETMLQGALAIAFAIGRWSKFNTLRAFAELERAARAAGQQEVLEEVRDMDRALRAGRHGRYTDHKIGRFAVGEIIGRGAMGEVYEARDSDGRTIALKVLHDQLAGNQHGLARFQRELTAMAAIDSPHVVRVVDSGLEPMPYLAMERLHGTDLAALLRERQRLEPGELVRMIDELARGLEAAHAAGFVHRDLKPSNVFCDDGTGRWKLLDFGVSKLIGDGGTLTGDRIIGTPAYMAPEQVAGGAIGAATDVYGLAAIAYRCLTGRTPFAGGAMNELLYRVAHSRPPRPSSIAAVSREIEVVLAVGLARDPVNRFASASAFAAALATALAGHQLDVAPIDTWA